MYYLTEKEVLDKLETSQRGLTNKIAEERLKKYGANETERIKRQSFFVRFLKQFLNIMVAILLLSAVVSISLAIINKEYADLFEGFVILFIVIMNALIGVIQENKAEACLKELQKQDRRKVKVIRDGGLKLIDTSLLVVGDIVEMETGNIVPADVRLIEVNNFACDESSLTGESVASEKGCSQTLKQGTPLAERINIAYGGSMVVNGKAKGVVFATGQNTEIGKIARLITSTKKETTPLQKSIDKIGKIITWVVLAVCVIILVASLIAGHGIKNAFMTSVALAVAAIPESLPAVITIIMALGVQHLAKRKCIIKHLHAVETLGSCQIICSDKTGTITQNKMQVVKVVSYDSLNNDFLKCIKHCNSAKCENGKYIGEPTEKALLEYANSRNNEKNSKIIHEIPFNSTRKMMTVVVDGGLRSYTKGAPDFLLPKCKYINLDGKIVPLTQELRDKINQQHELMTDEALRVIGFCYKIIDGTVENQDYEQNMIFLGFAGMIDNPRPEVEQSIKQCFKAGLKPVMITGDHKRTAFAIAKKLGIANNIEQVVTGEEIDKLTDKQLIKECNKYTVFARVSPEHKVRIVKAFKGLKKIVAMTGDGVNDAPSLKIADIGVGMGQSGTDVVKSVADMIVTDDNFASIVVAVEEGRRVYNNIQKALQFLISTNCVEVLGMLIALLFFPKYTFLLPAQMLFINLVTDSLPAFALGMEKVEDEIMLSPPRNPKAGLFSGTVGVGIIYQSILQTVIVVAVFLIGIFCYSPQVASTMVFLTIIFMQLLHSVNCKSNGSIIKKNLLENKTFNICFIITLFLNLLVACIPFMYTLFNLEFLNFSQWLVVVIASVLIIPACELFKAILIKEK